MLNHLILQIKRKAKKLSNPLIIQNLKIYKKDKFYFIKLG